jgi:mitochondrial import inner membrane translocase subunit TIM17
MGAVGGGIWNAIKNMKNSPNGHRIKGFTDGIRVHAPRVGGSFAGWGACYAVADCSLMGLRGKDDPLNSIAAGAFAGGFLQVSAESVRSLSLSFTPQDTMT